MTPETALRLVIVPTLDFMGGKFVSVPAMQMLLAIGLQESEFTHRVQVGGPAHGYWQFEQGGGVIGVLTHPASKDFASYLCHEFDHKPTGEVVYRALPNDSVLACAFARLLLYTDAKPLPQTERDGWVYYKRTWRPGKPHSEKWPENWKRAKQAINHLETVLNG